MIRPYEKKDWPYVEPLYKKHLKEWVNDSGYPTELANNLLCPLRQADIAIGTIEERDGQIRGFILGVEITPDVLRISDIYLDHSLRGTDMLGRLWGRFMVQAMSHRYKYLIGEVSRMHKHVAKWAYKIGFKTGEVHLYRRLI